MGTATQSGGSVGVAVTTGIPGDQEIKQAKKEAGNEMKSAEFLLGDP
jgi:hypothetical protein